MLGILTRTALSWARCAERAVHFEQLVAAFARRCPSGAGSCPTCFCGERLKRAVHVNGRAQAEVLQPEVD